jgi:hypothetical protein
VIPVITVGNMNFSCATDNCGYNILSTFINEYDLYCCDELTGYQATYVNPALGHSSCIAHVLISSLLRPSITAAEVIDCLDNHSDHRPISLCLTVASRVCNSDITCADH